MKEVYIEEYGALDDVIRTGDMPKPKPQPQDVLIEVRASGVNPMDWKIAEGYAKARIPLNLPAILGNELAGVVAETGSAVDRFKAGDEVYARLDPLRAGSFAEFVAADAKLVAAKPKNIDFIAAAAIPLAGLTAWQVLFEHIKLKKGQKVLIHAGSGGVGSFAIQFAKHIGAEVATTVSADGVELAKTLRADRIINYKNQRFEDVVENFDAVVDTIGGETQARSISALKPGGVLVSTVGITAAQGTAEKAGVRLEAIFMHPDGGQLTEIARLVDAGAVRPIIDHIFSLEQVKDALRYSKAGRVKGKIVIRVN